jgi:hypothetical protein
MKSIQVSIHIPQSEQVGYSDLQVLKSAAGWYVGTTYTQPGTCLTEPGSRDTDYFETEKDAAFVLQILERLNTSEGYKSSLWASQQEYITCVFDSILHELGLNPRNVGYRLHP